MTAISDQARIENENDRLYCEIRRLRNAIDRRSQTWQRTAALRRRLVAAEAEWRQRASEGLTQERNQ